MQKDHQTALFIDMSRSAQNNFVYGSRVLRLLESLNQEGDSPDGTIKCDIFSVSDIVKVGLQDHDGNGFDIGAAMTFARAHGYVMMMFVTPATFDLPTNTLIESTKEDIT